MISYHPAKIGCHRDSGIRGIMVFTCHLTLKDHVIKALYDFTVRSPSK